MKMEKYTDNLENLVAERTDQLEQEKIKTENLLYKMLPKYKIFISNQSHIIHIQNVPKVQNFFFNHFNHT